MALTDINSEDRLVQQTFAEHLEQVLGWESVYAYKAETFGRIFPYRCHRDSAITH